MIDHMVDTYIVSRRYQAGDQHRQPTSNLHDTEG